MTMFPAAEATPTTVKATPPYDPEERRTLAMYRHVCWSGGHVKANSRNESEAASQAWTLRPSMGPQNIPGGSQVESIIFFQTNDVLEVCHFQSSDTFWMMITEQSVSEFSVKGPAEPVMVLLGMDATLPCQLSPEQSAAHMHIWWYRSELSSTVLVYQNGQEQDGEQMLEYRGRTELLGDSIDKGSVALRIQHVRVSDDGQYRCHFKDGHISHETTVELNVVGLGSAPRVHMAGPEDGGIRILCSSGGWFPKPRLQWSDQTGVKLTALSETLTQDGDGLFHVEASLVVTDRTLGNVTCSIQNPISRQEKVSVIFLPEPFFPRVSPWKAALAGTVPVLMILLTGISYTGWKEHQAKDREVKKRKYESEERDKVKKEKEEALKVEANLKAELEKRKKLYDADWKKALLYPDWRKEHFMVANVTLKQEDFNQNNSDPDKKDNLKELTQDQHLKNEEGDDNFITLNQNYFTSGRYYWEVDVEDIEEWSLGIYEKDLKNDESPQYSSEKKLRVLEKKGCKYRALTYGSYGFQENLSEKCLQIEKCPQKIVVFLDYEDSDVSFYNLTDGSHIHTFNQPSFTGSLCPYFKPKSMDSSP
ncbi:butyrophilin-like protein 1 [Sorex araneus]|uniref:butyrophilin-like protein 1 n=1 Tax=Sorex araneus TaxID=42254 RepID=UPI0024334FAC|nr:butyrophilin-like protein 1 [Sorex araneus]